MSDLVSRKRRKDTHGLEEPVAQQCLPPIKIMTEKAWHGK